MHEKALKILERYDAGADRLFPFRQIHTYNLGIRELLKRCGIDRMVTILDTHGYNTVQKPLYEVATSHTARKTFVELTQVEFQIMEYFISNAGKALKRSEILKHVWGSGYVGEAMKSFFIFSAVPSSAAMSVRKKS